jgi:lysozyme family protein
MSDTPSAFQAWWAFCMAPDNDGQAIHNDPGDSGGWTAWGVTWRTYRAYAASVGLDPSFKAFRVLTVDQAALIAKPIFWDAIHGDEMPSAVGVIWADFHWTSGGATRVLQGTVGTDQDGVMGPNTLAAIQTTYTAGGLLQSMTQARIRYYQSLNDPEFIGGWTRRSNDCLTLAQTLVITEEPNVGT